MPENLELEPGYERKVVEHKKYFDALVFLVCTHLEKHGYCKVEHKTLAELWNKPWAKTKGVRFKDRVRKLADMLELYGVPAKVRWEPNDKYTAVFERKTESIIINPNASFGGERVH